MIQNRNANHNPTHHAIFVLLLLLPFIVLSESITTGDIRVKLIHPYSKHSPYYNPNLTKSQIIEKLYGRSRSHVESTNLTGLHPPLLEEGRRYLVDLRIGTGPDTDHSYLQLDTGSRLTWTTCQPCLRCNIRRRRTLFDPNNSPTYTPLPRENPFCTHRDSSSNCAFAVGYMDRSFAIGVLGVDIFTFRADEDSNYAQLVFGCANTVAMTHGPQTLDGILGMGWDQLSFPLQLHNRFGGQFSYCLVEPHSGSIGYLRFGHDLDSRTVGMTPIRRYPGTSHYYLNLKDISVGNSRLNIGPGIFERHRDHGGCFIDSGTSVSHLIKPAYDKVRRVLVEYLSGHGFHPTRGMRGLDLCYRIMDNYQRLLPSMTLHFDGADYHLDWGKVFIVDNQNGRFCWAVFLDESVTLIGAYQQYNTRFSFNIDSRELSFRPENCAHH